MPQRGSGRKGKVIRHDADGGDWVTVEWDDNGCWTICHRFELEKNG